MIELAFAVQVLLAEPLCPYEDRLSSEEVSGSVGMEIVGLWATSDVGDGVSFQLIMLEDGIGCLIASREERADPATISSETFPVSWTVADQGKIMLRVWLRGGWVSMPFQTEGPSEAVLGGGYLSGHYWTRFTRRQLMDGEDGEPQT